MYGVAHSFYLFVFLKSVGVGFIIGAVWMLFVLFRRLFFCGKVRIFIQDVLFFTAAALITFLFLFDINAGVMRFYIFAGEGMGFCLYRLLPLKTVVDKTPCPHWKAHRGAFFKKDAKEETRHKKYNKKQKKFKKTIASTHSNVI